MFLITYMFLITFFSKILENYSLKRISIKSNKSKSRNQFCKIISKLIVVSSSIYTEIIQSYYLDKFILKRKKNWS